MLLTLIFYGNKAELNKRDIIVLVKSPLQIIFYNESNGRIWTNSLKFN